MQSNIMMDKWIKHDRMIDLFHKTKSATDLDEGLAHVVLELNLK